MTDFHKSVRGIKFYDRDIPELTKAFNRMAAAMEENNKLIKEQIVLEKKKMVLSKGTVKVNESKEV